MLLFVDKISIDERFETKSIYKLVSFRIFPVIKGHGYKYELDDANSIQPAVVLEGAVDHTHLAEAFENIAKIIRKKYEVAQ